MQNGPPRFTPAISLLLDAARFMSALLITLDHAWLMTFGEDGLRGRPLLEVLLWRTSCLGMIGFGLFLTLSGYLVGGKLYGAAQPGFLKNYAIDRISRTYIVVLPLIVAAFAIMSGANFLFGTYASYGGKTCDAGVSDLLMTLVLLIPAYGADHCINAPIWTLTLEAFYYAFFALGAVAIARRRDRVGQWCAVFAAILVAYGAADIVLAPSLAWPNATLLPYASLWFMGMTFAHPYPGGRQGKLMISGAVALVLAQSFLRGDPADKEAPAAILLCFAILYLRYNVAGMPPARISRLIVAAAATTYSLYLAHSPVMQLTRTALAHYTALPLGEPKIGAVIVGIYFLQTALGLLAGWCAWWLIERHTGSIRTWIRGRTKIGHHTPVDTAQSSAGLAARR